MESLTAPSSLKIAHPFARLHVYLYIGTQKKDYKRIYAVASRDKGHPSKTHNRKKIASILR